MAKKDTQMEEVADVVIPRKDEPVAEEPKKDHKQAFIERTLFVLNSMADEAKAKRIAARVMRND